MGRASLVLLLALAASASACACEGPVGYQGPIPSVEARKACLGPLRGIAFVPPPGVLGGAELRMTGFAVGTEPAVCFTATAASSGEPGVRFVPVFTDGDCAALYRMVTGERMPRFEGELSAGFRAAIAPSSR